MTTWETVSAAVESALKASLTYAKITTISSAQDYTVRYGKVPFLRVKAGKK